MATTIFQPPTANAKIAHGNAEYYVMTLSLSASDSSGRNTCAGAMPVSEVERLFSEGYTFAEIGRMAADRGLSACSIACCVNRAGRGLMSNVQGARRRLTDLWFDDRPRFIRLASHQLHRERRKADRHGYKLAIRGNTNSDQPLEDIAPEWFDIVHAGYDYTKLSKRLTRPRPSNYHLTYSFHEGTRPIDLERVHAAGANMAVVFDVAWQPTGPEHARRFGVLPSNWTAPDGSMWPVIDGDAYDARFLDPRGVVVGLRLKGTRQGRTAARETGFADCRFAGGLVTITHPAAN